MKISQIVLKQREIGQDQIAPLIALDPNLVIVFAAPLFFQPGGSLCKLGLSFPGATLIGCSTAGEVSDAGVEDGSAVITAVCLESSRIVSGTTDLLNMTDSRIAGRRLAEQLSTADLRAVIVFGPGVNINGSALVEGMADVLGHSLPISGGLAGDDGAFIQTWTLHNAEVSDHAIVAIGLAGEALQVKHSSFGGWHAFGPARLVTRSEENVLYELDDEPALEVYKRYLGDYAKDLPASGLLFPFAMLGDDMETAGLTRTILGVDEKLGSVTLAGAIVQGAYLKLMHASIDDLLDGAEVAAEAIVSQPGRSIPTLAILVSCVGRKLVMGDRIDEEVEAVSTILGDGTTCTGYYSNGEISPHSSTVECQLHNQTMTITTIAER